MKTGMNSFRNKSHFRYHANSPLSFVELIIDAFDDASIVLIFFLMIFIMFAEITFVCVYSEDGTIVSFRLDKCFVFWQISGILTRSIPVNWPFWSCRGWSGRHLFPFAKLTFSSQKLSQDISLLSTPVWRMEMSVDRVKLGRYCVEWHYGIALRDEFCPSFLLNFVIANESKASPKQSHSAVQHNTDSVSRWSSKWPILTVFFYFYSKSIKVLKKIVENFTGVAMIGRWSSL